MPTRTPRSLIGGSPRWSSLSRPPEATHRPRHRHRVSTRSRAFVPQARRLLDLVRPTPRARSSLVAAGLIVGADVDPPAGEPRGEPGVLALLADRQREL